MTSAAAAPSGSTLAAVAVRYTRGTLALSFATSLAMGFVVGLFLLRAPGVRAEWVAPVFSTVLMGKWPVLVACGFLLMRMSVLAPRSDQPDAWGRVSSARHALAYAGGSCWVAALAWALALLAMVAGFAAGLELAHPERVDDMQDALLSSLRGDELLRGWLRAMLLGLALGWLVEAESRLDHPWQDDTGTRSMQLIVIGLLLIVTVEVLDAWLFWFAGDRG